MKQIISILLISLLAGCTSTHLLDGEYDVDKEYKARGMASVMAEVQNAISEEELYEKAIETAKSIDYAAEINFPYLNVTLTKVGESPRIVVFKLREVEKNHFIITKENDPNPQEVEFVYNPTDRSLSSIITKYIKR